MIKLILNSNVNRLFREDPGLVQVEIANGILVGKEVSGVDGVRFYAFRGVPYAQSPTASLRFKVRKRIS